MAIIHPTNLLAQKKIYGVSPKKRYFLQFETASSFVAFYGRI